MDIWIYQNALSVVRLRNKCPRWVTREAERQGASRDRFKKPGQAQKVTSLNRASHRDGKTREEATKLRSGTVDKNKHTKCKGPAEGSLPRREHADDTLCLLS